MSDTDNISGWPIQVFFYASDGRGPQHVHAVRDNRVAKFWLNPARLQRSGGFRQAEIRQIQRIVEQHRVNFLEEWDGNFNR